MGYDSKDRIPKNILGRCDVFVVRAVAIHEF